MTRSTAWFGPMLALSLAVGTTGCGYNTIQVLDEKVNQAQGQVQTMLQRRADLIPNLVSTVQGYAAHERQTLEAVVNARARATSVQLPAEALEDPAKVRQFQQAQGELAGALSRLLVVAENYPQLKADAGFRDLQAQLEGTENRITVARNRFIAAVQAYNVTVRSFPTNLTAKMFGHELKPSFAVEDEKAISAPPKVDFGK